jgi:hypothetical protein
MQALEDEGVQCRYLFCPQTIVSVCSSFQLMLVQDKRKISSHIHTNQNFNDHSCANTCALGLFSSRFNQKSGFADFHAF